MTSGRGALGLAGAVIAASLSACGGAAAATSRPPVRPESRPLEALAPLTPPAEQGRDDADALPFSGGSCGCPLPEDPAGAHCWDAPCPPATRTSTRAPPDSIVRPGPVRGDAVVR